MHIWLELIIRELLFVALLAALGAGPATFLSERFDGAARFALAPALGLSAGASGAVTLIFFLPTADTWWVLIPAALASLGVFAGRTRPSLGWPGGRTVAQLAVVTVVILGSFSYPLALRHTVGPDGGYAIADTAGYLSTIDGEVHRSIRSSEHLVPPFADLAQGYWTGYAGGNQQLDVTALESNVNELLGLGATDTQSPFLIAVLLTGALGVFAVVRAVSGLPTWAAVLGACIFAGPLFAELYMDGSEAAICGAAVLAPVVALGSEALRIRRPAALALFALVIAGLQTLYPLFLPAVVLGAGATVAVAVIRRLRRGLPSLTDALTASGQLALVIALACALTPVAFLRNARYWISLLNGTFSLAGLPAYVLPANVLPGWVLQTREFYNLPNLSSATAAQLLMGALVPLVLIGVIAFAAWRYREARLMVAVAAGASLLAYYTWSSRGCGYCVQRNLIPVGALVAPALGLGVAAIATLPSRARMPTLLSRARMPLAAAIALVAIIAIGREGIVERQRVANGSYLLDEQDRAVLSALPARPGPVELEGFGQGPSPPMELPVVYNLVDERTHGQVSIATDRDDNRGLLYLGGTQPLGPSFHPDYRYVLTRLAGISTGRRVIARDGPVALEQRTQPLDVTVTGGVLVGAARADPSGTAWVTPALPLHFLVAGFSPGRTAWISLVLQATVPVHVEREPGLSSVRSGQTVRICLPAVGTPPVREAGVQVSFVPTPAPLPDETYAPALPPRGVRLVSVRVSTTRC
jgi:hypothetical protein